MSEVVVAAVGALGLVEDLGRPGHAALGVTTSGAADRASLRLANRLVGNPEDTAGIEVLLGGLRLRARGRVTVAVTGAPTPLLAAGRPAALCAPLDLRDGDEVWLGSPSSGLRSYVAVAGGLLADPLLGSRSTDPTSGLGPPRLAPGQSWAVGPPSGPAAGTDLAAPRSGPTGPLVVGVTLGPRDDWFTSEAVGLLLRTAWAVTSESDRVGIRLDGPPLSRVPSARGRELPSEAVVRGSVQVPASGLPLVFGPDHPTTGGYPVIAVVDDDGSDQLAQRHPGQTVRFRPHAPTW